MVKKRNVDITDMSYRSMVENASDIIACCDRNGHMLYANPAFERVTGKNAEEFTGLKSIEMPIFGRRTGISIHRAILDVVDTGEPKEVEIIWKSAPDMARRIYLAALAPEFDGGRVSGVILTARDITGLGAHQLRLQHMAFYDPLTGLPNRALFNDRLERAIAERSRGEDAIIGLMLLDLDGFKAVNDVLGHVIGDRLLSEAGERIRACLRKNDTVARLGGDEFALLVPGARREIDLAVIARKILDAVGAPFLISGKELFVTTSIGIACCRADSVEPVQLLRFADTAMYHAKAMGRNNYQFHSESMTREARDRMELENDLRKALQQGELEIFYQPKVNTITSLSAGAEALLRWRHPIRGMVPPDRFIGIAEDTGLIVAIGDWVLHIVCAVASEYNRNAICHVRFSVNLSVRQLMTGNFVETVRRTLAETECRPEWLELEITESLLMSNRPRIMDSMAALDAMGIAIAIDDFGTGYSSLAYLSGLPISTIKIDKSFVQEIEARNRNLELVRAIVSLGQALGMELVAEGIETGRQAEILDSLGCHIIQGYLYARPMPVAEFMNWQTEFFRKRSAAARQCSELARTPWRDYLTTGHEVIDAQHHEIFKRITRLTDACRMDGGKREVPEMLDYLGEYILSHFGLEEELLRAAGSPRYEEHKADHDKFTETIGNLRSRFRREGATLALIIETNCVSVGWLIRHICAMDKDLASRIGQFNGMTAMHEKPGEFQDEGSGI